MYVTIPELGLELRPYGQGPCWQLFERVTGRTSKKGEPLPDCWRSCGKYPNTLAHGLATIREHAARESQVSGDLSAAIDELHRIDVAMRSAVEAAFERLETR